MRGSDANTLLKKYAAEILPAIEAAGKLDHQLTFASTDEDGTPCLVCSVFTTFKLGLVLQPFGINFRAKTMAVGVTAQRRSAYEDYKRLWLLIIMTQTH